MLTRFSQRYGSGDAQRLAGEAAMAFGGQVVLAHDLTGSPFRPAPASGQLTISVTGVTKADHPARGALCRRHQVSLLDGGGLTAQNGPAANGCGWPLLI